MITIKQAREIDPTLSDLSDEKLENVLLDLHELASLALEAFFYQKAEAEGSTPDNEGLLQSILSYLKIKESSLNK